MVGLQSAVGICAGTGSFLFQRISFLMGIYCGRKCRDEGWQNSAAQTPPEGLVKQIEAKVWQGNILMEQLARWEYRLRVVNLRNEPDGTVTLRYLADAPQLPDSVPAQPRLEDLYLWLFPEEMEEAK